MLPADDPRLRWWVRGVLLAIAGTLITVFSIAFWLKPDPRGMGTHQQLGLPPCTFQWFTGLPCPSCGMTTSFSHFVRGELLGSLSANAIGTLLAAFCVLLIPYCLLCGVWGRRLWVNDYEALTARVVIVFIILLLGGWGVRLGWRWWQTGSLLNRNPAPAPQDSRRRGHDIPLALVGPVDHSPHRHAERLPAPGAVLPRGHHDGV